MAAAFGAADTESAEGISGGAGASEGALSEAAGAMFRRRRGGSYGLSRGDGFSLA